MKTRLEHDLLGALEVPADAYYGIHTLRACENFNISGLGIHPELIRSLALVKKACAIANMRTEYLDEKIGNAIVQACDVGKAVSHREVARYRTLLDFERPIWGSRCKLERFQRRQIGNGKTEQRRPCLCICR